MCRNCAEFGQSSIRIFNMVFHETNLWYIYSMILNRRKSCFLKWVLLWRFAILNFREFVPFDETMVCNFGQLLWRSQNYLVRFVILICPDCNHFPSNAWQNHFYLDECLHYLQIFFMIDTVINFFNAIPCYWLVVAILNGIIFFIRIQWHIRTIHHCIFRTNAVENLVIFFSLLYCATNP